MKLKKLLSLSLLAVLVFACNKNDDDGPAPVPDRDRGEQAMADDQALLEYLNTHFYNYEEFKNPSEDFDYVVRFDTIAGVNADKKPITESDSLITKTINKEGIDQQVYVLKVREGKGKKAEFSDSTFVAYRGELLNSNVFDTNLQSPIWFELSGYQIVNQRGQIARTGGVIDGFKAGLMEFRSATSFEVNADNTIKWSNDFGIGAVFLPSGLGYFSQARAKIPSYSPLIFSINMYRVKEADHDGDGIPTKIEDLNGNADPFDEDTDEDGLANHSDGDDDGDGTPTRDEIIINEDGSIEFPDKNNDGTPDYLDPNVFQDSTEDDN